MPHVYRHQRLDNIWHLKHLLLFLRHCRQRVLSYNLGQPELVSKFTYVPDRLRQQQQAAGNSWMNWHPQLLLQPTGQLANVLRAARVQWDAYDPTVGFIGFAENLIRLSQQQLGLRIAVQGVEGENPYVASQIGPSR